MKRIDLPFLGFGVGVRREYRSVQKF